MTPRGPGISVRQFFALFFLSRIFGLLTFINEPGAALSAKNGSLLFLPYFLFAAAFSLPALLLSNRTRADGPLFPAKSGKRAFSALSAAYGVFFLVQAALGAALLDRFISETMFSTGGHPLLFLVFCALALLTARNGIETPARAAPPLLAAMLVAFCLIAAATVSYFEPENLTPLSETGPVRLLKNGAFAALRTAEPAAMVALAGNIRGKKTARLLLTVFSLGATASLLFTLIAGVTGSFGETQTFQLFTLTTLAELGTVERMDDILCAAWIFCAFLRTVFHLCAALRCFPETAQKSPGAKTEIAAGTLLFLFYLLLSYDSFFRRWIEDRNGNVWLCALFVFILPLIANRVIMKRKEKS